MVFSKAALTLLFVGIMALYVPTCFSQPADSTVGVNPGNWAKYIGSFPYEEYEWMGISILNVNETQVNMSLSCDLRYPYRKDRESPAPRLMNIDIETGVNNVFLFLVPSNLTVGDIIHGPSDTELTVDGVESRAYAGANRTIISANYSNIFGLRIRMGEGILYWDKETGLLVEVLAEEEGGYFSTLRLVETNVWPIDIIDWVAENFPFLILGPASVALHTVLLLILTRRREKSYKVSYPLRGKILISIGLLLLANSIIQLSHFYQFVSSVSVAFSFVFLVVGVLIHTGAWADRKSKMDLGVVLISLSVSLFGSFVACALYREIGALIPYMQFSGVSRFDPRPFLTIESVFLYPYSQLASLLITIAFSSFVCGLFFKTLRKPTHNLKIQTMTM